MKTLIASIALFAVAAVAAQAAETTLAWPQFRGPGGSGVADDQKPPVTLSKEVNVKWKVAVPSGISSPIVAGDNLVLTGFDGGKLYVVAYRRATGDEAWRAEVPADEIEPFHKTEGSPAASTPATDGTRIVSYFGSCGLVCHDLSGRQLWRFELPTAAVPGRFGSGVSPILADGIAVVVRDQMNDSHIYGVDVATGKARWERTRISPASYSTPLVWDTPDGKQVASAGHARMTGYDLQSGEEKWTVTGLPSACVASPVTAEGKLLFAGSSSGGAVDREFKLPSFDSFLKDLDKDSDGALSRAEAEKAFQGFFDNQDANQDGKVTREEWDTIAKFMSQGQNVAFALSPGGTGDVTQSHVVWKQTKGLPYVASAIAYRGQYLTIKDGGIVTAFDVKSGDQIYTGRVAAEGRYYASPVAANGHVYFTSLDGAVTVLAAGSPKPVVVAKNAALEERISATPAIADDRLYVRTEKNLYAFGEK